MEAPLGQRTVHAKRQSQAGVPAPRAGRTSVQIRPSWLWRLNQTRCTGVHASSAPASAGVLHALHEEGSGSQHSVGTEPPQDQQSDGEEDRAAPHAPPPLTFDALTLLSSLDEEINAPDEGRSAPANPMLAILPLLGIGLLLGVGFLLKDQIKEFLDFFITVVDDWGPWGYLAYAATYTALEVLAIPSIPLTMTAGVIFGPVPGTAIVAVSGTLAATIAFLIARYAARDKILQWAQRNRRFAAIDKAIGRDGFKFVTLLRLSPLFPFAASNYLYGLTSVDLGSYVAGSFLGTLPGTYAYVSAGHVGKAVLKGGEGSLGVEVWQVAVGLGVTVLALGFVGQLAKQAIEDVDKERNEGSFD